MSVIHMYIRFTIYACMLMTELLLLSVHCPPSGQVVCLYIQVLTNMSSFKGDYSYQYNEDNGVE